MSIPQISQVQQLTPNEAAAALAFATNMHLKMMGADPQTPAQAENKPQEQPQEAPQQPSPQPETPNTDHISYQINDLREEIKQALTEDPEEQKKEDEVKKSVDELKTMFTEFMKVTAKKDQESVT